MAGNNTSEIRNIIFDLGGVLLNINPLLSLQAFEKLSGIDKDELLRKLVNEQVFEKFDTGSLSPDQFREELCRIMACDVSDDAIDSAWNILLLDFPLARVEMLQQLRKNYRIFLLSNTNSIHYEKYTNDFFERYGIQLVDLFDFIFLSYEIGMHKPDPGIYDHVLKYANLNPSECVFIDDSLPNIEAATRFGITGIHINSGRDVTQYFENGVLRMDSY
jgi:glucose-1-phosphatase